MINIDNYIFQLLKKEIETKYKSFYPDCNLAIHEWKGKEILNLQESLQTEVNGRVSEKWFYTHLKTTKNDKLPRIDILNLLCEYTGYKDWQEFVSQKQTSIETGLTDNSTNQSELKLSTVTKKPDVKYFTIRYKYWFAMGVAALILAVIIFSKFEVSAQEKYTFCFVDADLKKPIKDIDVEITIIYDDESPFTIICSKQGCFDLETDKQKVKFSINAPYYKSDTIVRYLNKNKKTEIISLETDDYALMINIFSTSKITDWKKRRRQLEKMIADDVQIFQIDKNNRGVEIYNKQEFIDKLTIPLNSLKNIEILETKYKGDEILMMRFTQ